MFRLPWDTLTTIPLPMCNTMEQLIYHEIEYHQLTEVRESNLLEITGCSLPCRYKEYKIVDTLIGLDGMGYGFSLLFAKTEIVEEKEVLVYEFISFVAEFGGALGLFLGFSFVSSWEFLEVLFIAFYKQKKKIMI